MILTKEQLQLRVESPDNFLNLDQSNTVVELKKYQGANGGRHNKDDFSREEQLTIGVLDKTIGSHMTSEVMGVSVGYASSLGNGKVSHKDGNEEFKNQLDKRLGKIIEKSQEVAAERLLSSLGLITDDKLVNASAKDLSTISANLSKVSLNLKPSQDKNSNLNGPKVNIVLFQPKIAKEEEFNIIEVSA